MSTPKTKPNVCVIGAGLSGLAAAYELSQNKKVNVIVYEARSEVGGRVKSVLIDNHPIDVGGFIIYPWYTEYHRLIREMNLQNKLQRIKNPKIYYQLDPDGPYIIQNKIKIPIWQKLKLAKKILPAWLRYSPNFRKPDLNYFKNKTISDTLRTTKIDSKVIARFIDVVNQGYCYAGIDDFQMSFYAPLMYQTLIHGDLNTGQFFKGNNQMFPLALAEHIKRNGGKIELDSEVSAISNKKVTVNGKNKEFDAILFANQVGPTYKNIISTPVFEYTHFYAAVVRLSKPLLINGRNDWTAVFTAIVKNMNEQITSVIRAESMVPELAPDYLIINYKTANKNIITESVLTSRLNAELARLFPGSRLTRLMHAIPWKDTMPIANTEFVREVREKNGKNGYFFAGDYLGSPSMETAVSSGIQAAQTLIKTLF